MAEQADAPPSKGGDPRVIPVQPRADAPHEKDTTPDVKVCLDCPTIIPTGNRCPTCARRNDKARGTRQQRGYDATHDRLRRHYTNRMNTGETFTCWRCGDPITGPFDLGHDDHDRSIYRGPEHPACNRATNGR